jgi:hypothetical protein
MMIDLYQNKGCLFHGNVPINWKRSHGTNWCGSGSHVMNTI